LQYDIRRGMCSEADSVEPELGGGMRTTESDSQVLINGILGMWATTHQPFAGFRSSYILGTH